MKARRLAIVLLLLSGFAIGHRALGVPWTDLGAGAGFLALCLVGLRTSSIREKLLFAASVALSGLLFWQGDGWDTFWVALDLAAFFAAFILLLTALQIAANRSQSVLDVGRYLIRQPASGRYIATAGGGHFLGVFLNFAAISLMAPLIQNAAKGPDGQVDTALERRQISALLRGFAWILLWAPTTLTQAVLMTLFTEVSYPLLIGLGVSTAFAMMLVGFLFDRVEWRGTGADEIPAPLFPKRAFVRLMLVCALLILGTGTLQIAAGYTTALALMIVAPAVTFAWFLAQHRQGRTAPLPEADPAGGANGPLHAFWGAVLESAPSLARSAIALGLSGFIGRVLADVLPVAALTASLDLAAVPGWVFLSLLPVLITLGGQVAVSPIILVVFLGQAIQTLPTLPADPTHIVFALSAGWALSMFASPNATATLLISATTRLAPTQLTWAWNLKYAAVCYILLVGVFGILTA